MLLLNAGRLLLLLLQLLLLRLLLLSLGPLQNKKKHKLDGPLSLQQQQQAPEQ